MYRLFPFVNLFYLSAPEEGQGGGYGLLGMVQIRVTPGNTLKYRHLS